MSAGPGSSAPETVLLSPQNPWPGLVSFSEANQAFFFGREQEIADLVRRIAQEPLTIFFGKSGLGKSSILQAGLTPEFRRNAFVPIYIRLDYAAQAPPLARQALDHIRGVLDREGIDAPRPAGDQSLWEYFHTVGCDWWDHHNQLVKPILMFDQFEELLTLGQSTPAGQERIQDFLRELEDLVDNRVPAELERRLSTERGLGQQFDFNRTACHIILALREDYLADLESLHERLRPIMRNRFRLLPMNTQQAVDVVLKPGKDLVDPEVALKIVQFVSSSERGHVEQGNGDEGAALQVEPALLSVVLQELNNRRLQKGLDKVTADLLGEGHAADILQHFYERGLQDLGPQAGDFIVDYLLTTSGARNRIAEEDALTKPGITPEVIAVLIDRRIIQRQSSGHLKWLELTHDTLADVVNRGRTEIRQRRDLEAAAAREQEIHRNLVRSRKLVSLFATLAMVALAALAGLGYTAWQRKAFKYSLHQLEQMNRLQANTNAQLDIQKDQLNSALTTSRAEEKSLAYAKQSLTEKIRMLRIRDETLEAGAEHESAEKVKTLWDALVDPRLGESDRVLDAMSLLESDSDRFKNSPSLQRRNVLGHALGAQILYSFGAIHDGFAAAQQAVALADSLPVDPAALNEIRLARAAALVALGRGELELGRYDAAAKHLQSGLAVTEEAPGSGSGAIDRNKEIAAMARIGLGDISLLHYSDEAARAQYDLVLHLAEGGKTDPVLTLYEALAYQLIAISYYQDATPADDRKSDQAFRHAHALLHRMMRDNPNNLRWRSLYAETTARQAMVLDNREKYSDAFPLLQEIRPIAEEVFDADQSNESSRYVLAMIDRGLGKFYRASGDAANAAVVFTRAVENAHEVVTQQPDWIKAGVLYGLVLREQVFTPEQKQERKKALIDSRTEFEFLATVAKDNPQVLINAADVIQEIGTVEAEEEEAKAEKGKKDYSAADNAYSQAGTWFERMTPELRQRPTFARIEALRNFNKGYYIFRPLKRLAEEEEAYQKAAAMFAGLIEREPSTLNYQNLGITYVNLGDVHLAAGDPVDQAVQEFQKALSTYDEGVQYLKKQGQNSIPLLANGIEQQVRIAGVWRQNKQYERAESSLQAAVTVLRTSLQLDIMQPELLVVFREASKEAEDLEKAVREQAASDARGELLANLKKTKTDIDLGKFLWPKGANPNAAGNLLDVPETLGWSAPPLVPGAWLQLSSAEQAQEQKKLATGGEIAAKVAPNILRIRKLHVTFYPEATLFEAEVRRSDGVTGVFDYVRSGDKVMELDGTSSPIHKFEKFTASDKGMPRKLLRLDTAEQASQYMHFFIGSLSTEEGTFRVVNSVADITFLPDASLEAREKLGRAVKPFRLLQNSDGKWVYEASIQYSDSISYAVLTIDTTTVSTVVDMKSETLAAADQPLQSEFVTNGLRILSDYPYRRNLLTSEVEKQRKANNWQAELQAENQLVPLIRDTEVLSSAKRSELLIPRYLALSWLLLLSRDFKGALEASEAGLKLNPKELSLDTNRAHALLFLGRKDDAMEVYRKNIGKLISKRSWEEIILEDLDQLEKNHVSNPAFAEVRDMMRKAKPGL